MLYGDQPTSGHVVYRPKFAANSASTQSWGPAKRTATLKGNNANYNMGTTPFLDHLHQEAITKMANADPQAHASRRCSSSK